MSEIIRGTQVSWGIPTAGKTVADSIVTGIVQDFEVSTDANVSEIADEDGDFVAAVYHGQKNQISLTTLVTATDPTLPAKGDLVTVSSALGGVDFTAGEVYVESASIAYAGTNTTTVSLTLTHYPDMTTPTP